MGGWDTHQKAPGEIGEASVELLPRRQLLQVPLGFYLCFQGRCGRRQHKQDETGYAKKRKGAGEANAHGRGNKRKDDTHGIRSKGQPGRIQH